MKAYPPHRNQHARPHWPLIRLVVLQDVQTGLALLRPHWGPETVSGQALGLEAIAHLPPQAVVIGDRNFGVFGVAWTACQQGHPVPVRLTRARAGHLAGGSLRAACAGTSVGSPHAGIVAAGPIRPGRRSKAACFACRRPSPLIGNRSISLPLWNCLPVRSANLYSWRWNVETDLRSIKQTVHRQQLTAPSAPLLEKELLLAWAAYHLVRAGVIWLNFNWVRKQTKCVCAGRKSLGETWFVYRLAATVCRLDSPLYRTVLDSPGASMPGTDVSVVNWARITPCMSRPTLRASMSLAPHTLALLCDRPCY